MQCTLFKCLIAVLMVYSKFIFISNKTVICDNNISALQLKILTSGSLIHNLKLFMASMAYNIIMTYRPCC